LCYEDREALDLLDQETTGKQGERTDLVTNRNEVTEGVGGNHNNVMIAAGEQAEEHQSNVKNLNIAFGRRPIGETRQQEAPGAAVAVVSKRHFSHLSPGKPTRERTKHRGFYILPSQERAIKRIVADLALDDDRPLACNDSLLVRAAIDVLLSLPPAALRATVATYKEREAAAQVGSGWPRPGKR
jgi:hypothetical protein